MKKIAILRKRIDKIDEQILRSLKERLEVCQIIGATKQKNQISIRDYSREHEIYQHIMRQATEFGLNAHQVKKIYQQIIAMCIYAQDRTSKTLEAE